MTGIVFALVVSACGGDDDAAGADVPDDADVVPTAGDAAVETDDGASEGERLPDVELVGLGDQPDTSLADIEGPAVINLWATWCAPCRREIPAFEEVHQAQGDAVRFVGINVGESADQASAFVDEVGATYDQFLDPEGYVITELGTTSMPTTVVIDGDGIVSTRHLGPMSVDDLESAIARASS